MEGFKLWNWGENIGESRRSLSTSKIDGVLRIWFTDILIKEGDISEECLEQFKKNFLTFTCANIDMKDSFKKIKKCMKTHIENMEILLHLF